MFVDCHNKIDITFKFCTFSYKAISQIGANYQLNCVNGIKDTGYLLCMFCVPGATSNYFQEPIQKTILKAILKIAQQSHLLSTLKEILY